VYGQHGLTSYYLFHADALPLANFVGIVVGFLNVLVNTPAEPPPCRRGSLLNATWHKITLKNSLVCHSGEGRNPGNT
jgi:hypothetical protein